MSGRGTSRRPFARYSRALNAQESPEALERRRAVRSEKKAHNKALWAELQARKKNVVRATPGRPRKSPDRNVVDQGGAAMDEPPPPELPTPDFYTHLENFEQFCRDCLVIITKEGKRAPLILNSSQRVVLTAIRKLIASGIPPRLAILKARQVGISTLIEALLAWDCLMRSDRSALVVAHTLKTSKALFRMSRNYHRLLKGAMQQKTRIQNVHEIEFDSGSRLQVEVQGDPRGYTAQRVHLAEFAYFLQAKETLTAIMQTVPATLDSLAVIESTANGMGGIGQKFHQLWQRAVGLSLDGDVPDEEKGWTPIFIPWFQHEEYEIDLGSKPFFLTSLEEKLVRDHPAITPEKLKWRRWCISTNLDGDEEKFAQEYPATDQEAFSLSGRPAFDIEAVNIYTKELSALVLAKEMPPRSEIEVDNTGHTAPTIIVAERGRLRIFFDKQPRHTYVVGADPSEGDPGSDPSPLAVLDDQTMNVAATWYGKAPPDVLACHAIDLAHYFNDALIIHEANNHGILFQSTVTQIGYPNFYYREVSADSVSGEVTDKPGYLATERNRQNLFDTLRKYVRMRMGKIRCPYAIQQIQTCVYIEDKVQAGVGSEKDLLVAIGLCLMAHRGSMNNELAPYPEEMVRSVATTAQLMKEREGVAAAERFVVESGMSMDEVLNLSDAILARDKSQKRFGLGGMR